MLAQLGSPGDVRRLVRGHHERLDGSGYPPERVLRREQPELALAV